MTPEQRSAALTALIGARLMLGTTHVKAGLPPRPHHWKPSARALFSRMSA